MHKGCGVESYSYAPSGIVVTTETGEEVAGDVLIGADGIWSAVRATMRQEPVKVGWPLLGLPRQGETEQSAGKSG